MLRYDKKSKGFSWFVIRKSARWIRTGIYHQQRLWIDFTEHQTWGPGFHLICGAWLWCQAHELCHTEASRKLAGEFGIPKPSTAFSRTKNSLNCWTQSSPVDSAQESTNDLTNCQDLEHGDYRAAVSMLGMPLGFGKPLWRANTSRLGAIYLASSVLLQFFGYRTIGFILKILGSVKKSLYIISLFIWWSWGLWRNPNYRSI